MAQLYSHSYIHMNDSFYLFIPLNINIGAYKNIFSAFFNLERTLIIYLVRFSETYIHLCTNL